MGFFPAKPELDSAGESVSSVNCSRLAAQTPIGAPFWDPILSSKYWDSDTRTLAYQLRDYGPGMGRWLSRDPIGEFTVLLQMTKGKSRREALALAAESLQPAYLFVRNAPVNNADKDGCSLVGAGVGITLVAIAGGAVWKGLCKAHAGAVVFASNQKLKLEMPSIDPGYSDGDMGIEGTIADAMQHCVGACELISNKGICCFDWVIKKGLKDYEKGKTDPAALMDLANNDVGIGVSGDCLDGCKAKLKAGGLKCLDSAGNLTTCKP